MEALELTTPRLAMGSLPLCAASAAVGVLAHLLYFIHGHKNMLAQQIAVSHIMSSSALTWLCISSKGFVPGLLFACAMSSSYLAGLFGSILVYRLFFHRLRSFPGPLTAKITKFYGPYLARDMQLRSECVRLLDEYGDMVRFAPNELIMLSVDALQKIHGAHSKCSKRNTLYETMGYNGCPNLDSMLDRGDHRWRRQVWDKAMNTKALETYERNAREVVHEWLGKVKSLEGRPINTSLYALLIPFENMGRMGFSKKFGSITAGKEDPMLELIEETVSAVARLGNLAWPIPLFRTLGLAGVHQQFEKLSIDMAQRRVEADDGTHEDIMKYFLQDLRSEKPKSVYNADVMYADVQAVMFGGTDTIAAALSMLFYWIARDPKVQKKLRAELAPLFGRTIPGEFANVDLGEVDAEYLNAIITESLRLDTPTGNNGPRTTPPEGLEIDGRHIPGDVAVYVPVHAMHRSAKFFREPNSFIPERWMDRPDLIIDRRAYHPFLLGPYNCVGRRLALMVLRFVAAYTVWNYDFKFAPGEDGTAIHRELRDQGIIKAGNLECVFRARKAQ